jgi:methylated-DNA-[protein]-cysteine S-methyltransferase
MASRVTLAAALPSPLTTLSRSGRIEAEAHFVGRSLLLRLRGPDASPEVLRKALAEVGGDLEGADAADGLSFLVHGELPERRLVDAIERAGGVVLPPLRWRAGEVRVDALQLRVGLGEAVRAACPEARVVRKRTTEGDPASELLREGALLPAMTRKQGEAILAALDAGYYDVPRKVTTLEVAQRLGVARSTFEEHLKRAEGQFVAGLAPLARLQLASEGAPRAEAVHLYAQFSAVLGLYVTLAVRGERVTRVRLARAAPAGAEPAHPHLARILEHLATGKGDLADVPLDLEVSDFERRVLDELRRVPPGEVVTYGQLARRLGAPSAARAVGNAVAHNPAPIVVPCHRVVRGDGDLGNYSAMGGRATKAKLLAIEGAPPRRKPRRTARRRT